MLDHATALELMESKIENINLRKHIRSVESGLRQLARRFGEDEEFWGLVGLLHDLDYNETKDDEPRHTFLTEEWLAAYNVPDEMIYTIRCHPGHAPCKSRLDWALYCVDPTTGFLVACALMHPSKSLAGLDEAFLLKRFKEKRFAAGANRDNIAACSEIGLELPEFLLEVRDGMRTISDYLQL
ncbi:MAG TPA: HD domain-containing protein [candidate division Zixibacteria bacterium]|nr:HD domain-containing protein [candidate division Zixibacteria bacterium]